MTYGVPICKNTGQIDMTDIVFIFSRDNKVSSLQQENNYLPWFLDPIALFKDSLILAILSAGPSLMFMYFIIISLESRRNDFPSMS